MREKNYLVGYKGDGQCVYGRENKFTGMCFISPMTLDEAEQYVKGLVSNHSDGSVSKGVIFNLVEVKPKKQVGIDKVYIGTHACRICVEKNDGFMCDAENGIDCINNLCNKIDNMGDTIDKFVAKNTKLQRVCDCAEEFLDTFEKWHIEKYLQLTQKQRVINSKKKLQQALKDSV